MHFPHSLSVIFLLKGSNLSVGGQNKEVRLKAARSYDQDMGRCVGSSQRRAKLLCCLEIDLGWRTAAPWMSMPFSDVVDEPAAQLLC